MPIIIIICNVLMLSHTSNIYLRRHQQTQTNTKIIQKSISNIIIVASSSSTPSPLPLPSSLSHALLSYLCVFVCSMKMCRWIWWCRRLRSQHTLTQQKIFKALIAVQKVSEMLSRRCIDFMIINKICTTKLIYATKWRVVPMGQRKRQTISYDNTQWWMINDKNFELLFTSVRCCCHCHCRRHRHFFSFFASPTLFRVFVLIFLSKKR